MRAPLCLLAVVLLCGCPPIPPPPPVLDDSNPDDCGAACANLVDMGCPTFASDGPDEVPGTADDVPCHKVCEDYVAQGAPVRPRCISKAVSCDQVDNVCSNEDL